MDSNAVGERVADIFFSYSSHDRERVRQVRDALADNGFDVFWDQQTSAGMDWDTWIRRELGKSKCAVVFWSATSAASDNVRHEATVAKQQGKLISVFIDPLVTLSPSHSSPTIAYADGSLRSPDQRTRSASWPRSRARERHVALELQQCRQWQKSRNLED
jgi:hypothetical protein